jgi:hypothetical protein
MSTRHVTESQRGVRTGGSSSAYGHDVAASVAVKRVVSAVLAHERGGFEFLLRLGDGRAERVEGDRVWFGAATDAGVERVDSGEVVGGELEVEDVVVLGDAGRIGRLGNGRPALLQVPTHMVWAAVLP